MGVGWAQAKLLLMGEHAAVYGHPAVGFALPWRLTVTGTSASQWELPGLGDHEPAVRRLLERFAALAVEEGLAPPKPQRLDVQTDIPLASGFGSSGALCAALVNLFWPDEPLAHRDRLAWKAEGLFHGTPSGIDTALALRQGWWSLDASTRPVTASPLPDPQLVLVAGAVVRESSTKALVADLARRRAEGDSGVIEALDQLGALSSQAREALSSRRPDLVVPLISQARQRLRDLGLESPALTAVIEAGLGCPGALAGKLSGAGGGGAFYLVFGDTASAQTACSVIEAAASASAWTCRPTVVYSSSSSSSASRF